MGRVFVGGGTGQIDTGASGNVNSVSGAPPIESSGGADPVISLTLPDQTEGDVLYFNGNTWTRLPAGAPGQALTTEGPSAPPRWTTVAAGGVSNVTGTAPVTSTGGPTPNIGITAATDLAAGSMSAADKTKLDGITPGAAVASVTGTAPIVSSGGDNPDISITAATELAAGSMSAADKTKLDGLTEFSVVFDPTGVPGSNVFTTWTALYAAMGAVQGGVRCSVSGSAHITIGGPYALDGWTFVSANQGDDTLFIDVGVTIAPGTLTFDDEISVESNATAPVITSISGVLIIVDHGSVLLCGVAAGIFVSGQADIFVLNESELGKTFPEAVPPGWNTKVCPIRAASWSSAGATKNGTGFQLSSSAGP